MLPRTRRRPSTQCSKVALRQPSSQAPRLRFSSASRVLEDDESDLIRSCLGTTRQNDPYAFTLSVSLVQGLGLAGADTPLPSCSGRVAAHGCSTRGHLIPSFHCGTRTPPHAWLHLPCTSRRLSLPSSCAASHRALAPAEHSMLPGCASVRCHCSCSAAGAVTIFFSRLWLAAHLMHRASHPVSASRAHMLQTTLRCVSAQPSSTILSFTPTVKQ